MKKMQLVKGMRMLRDVASKNAPSILTGLAVAGVVTTVVLAIKATPKADEAFKEVTEKEEVTKLEIVKAVVPHYIPTIISGSATIACMVGSHTISLKRQAALASLYSISETALKKYEDKVVEKIGEKKNTEIKDEIRQDMVGSYRVVDNELIPTGKPGETLCFDAFSGRYFYNDMESIRSAINDLNYCLMSDMWVSLNELYYAIGLNGIKLGDELGWNVDHMIEPEFTSSLVGGEPCLVLDFHRNSHPIARYDYKTLM